MNELYCILNLCKDVVLYQSRVCCSVCYVYGLSICGSANVGVMKILRMCAWFNITENFRDF